MSFEKITPEKAGIKSKYIIEFTEECKRLGMELHSFMFLRHGKVFAQSWYKPYNEASPHIMFSFTKSLTSTAIGFAHSEGLLSIDDYLLDIFKDEAPENPGENLKKCQLKHLLMMGCGHEEEIPRLGMSNGSWIKDFMNQPFVYEPGTHFMYNTAGTNMLAAALKRKTGMNLMDFLKPRLFDKIGMGEVPCYTLSDGTQMGGAGSRLTTEQMAKFIQFVANKGSWNGEQILDEAWFDMATAKQISNAGTSAWADWNVGYGFQFWRCAPEGVFRADGAFGQFGVVCPKEDAVFIVTSASTNFNKILDVLWKVILPHLGDEEPEENPEDTAILNYILKNNQISPLYSSRMPWVEPELSGKTYVAKGEYTGNWADYIGGAGISPRGAMSGLAKPFSTEKMTEITVEFKEYSLNMTAKVGGKEECLPISLESRFNSFMMSGKVFGAVGKWTGADTFEFLAYCAEAATGKRVTVKFGDKTMAFSQVSAFPDPNGLNDGNAQDMIFTIKE